MTARMYTGLATHTAAALLVALAIGTGADAQAEPDCDQQLQTLTSIMQRQIESLRDVNGGLHSRLDFERETIASLRAENTQLRRDLAAERQRPLAAGVRVGKGQGSPITRRRR